MKYGDNTILVQEVIDFISNNLLFGNEDKSNLNSLIIKDFEKAKNLAWSQNSESVDILWQDIKSNESSKILSIISRNEDLKMMEDELYDIFLNEENYNEEFFPMEFWDINEEVQSDLYKCALNRLVNGQKESFYEYVFEIYQAGGWACGWEGQYPEGKPIIFIPNEGFER
ncbi:hypothetical protein [Paenibacillus bovis]|uniref:Cytoplasmic protein n=1 Tax=Paenibacillus bovis TaxID=1616788 RepID=A0A172ZI44_9BACL|nr:hypothetical protein [Paenibacillus bovis]ANF97258.1 cytoplasmic protein [Paenibacillus bovis]